MMAYTQRNNIEMASELVIGKFKLTVSENFEHFLKELGLGKSACKVAVALSPTVTITKDGDMYTLKTSSTFMTSEIKFKLGEEFEEERQDGVKVKSTITADGNKLIYVQKDDEKMATIVHEFTARGFIAVAEVNGVVSTRIFHRNTE